MKIDQTSINPRFAANQLTRQQSANADAVGKTAQTPEHDSRSEAVAETALSGKDRAALSERSRLMAKMRGVLAETPDARSEKVAALRQQVETGDYQVPVEALVEKLVSRLVEG